METRTSAALLADLDDLQRLAVTSDSSPLLVVAGAGSGKTRVLTRRVAWRAAQELLDPSHTIALTFTRKAAGELRQRLEGLGVGTRVTAGTFHAIALGELRRRDLDLGKTPPVLLESKARLLNMVLSEMGLKLASSSDQAELLSAIASEIEWAKARLITPPEYVSSARESRRSVEGLRSQSLAEVFAGYEAMKLRRRVVDFDDLLINLAASIHTDDNFRAAQQWRFRHFFVDELQDATRAQLNLLDAWLGGRSDLFAVGDASQAIYGWNGADASGVTDFTIRYPGATVLELEQNYRSTPQLIAVAKAVLPRGTSRTATTPRPDGPTPHLVAYADEFEEASAIAKGIHTQRSLGRRFSECAVLARTNAQLEILKAGLDEAGVPLRSQGVDGFLGRASIRDAIRPIASSTQPARFAQWRRDLEESRGTRPGASSGAREDDDPEARAITLAREVADRRALAEIAAEYASLDPMPQGRGFVTFLRQSLGAETAPVAEDAVDVITFHRAKGLEWPVVYVSGLEDGYVPISRSVSKEALDEERRLLYVALSRAEDELFCSWAKTRTFGSRIVTREPSPYIDAIEEVRRRLGPTTAVDNQAARVALAASRAALGRPGPQASS
jgi:DNA helicase II / ATP-dependent DNA helicase PcrA